MSQPTDPHDEYRVEVFEEGMSFTVCGLCGNTGVLDTRHNTRTPRGSQTGVLAYCMCANGRASKRDKETIIVKG